MKKSFFVAIVAVLVWNCREKEKKSESRNDTEVTETGENVPRLEKGCYGYDDNNNTILFEIENTTGQVSGKLMYRLDGKDKNTGRFEGALREDLLLGTYTFMSEGRESSREVAFQVKDGQLIEGYGELNKDGTSFKDRDSIEFTSAMPLNRGECDP